MIGVKSWFIVLSELQVYFLKVDTGVTRYCEPALTNKPLIAPSIELFGDVAAHRQSLVPVATADFSRPLQLNTCVNKSA